MPAGSGPIIAAASAVVMAADTNEHVLATIPASNWAQGALGTLVSFSVLVTGGGAGNLTLRVRQGSAITGTQVGASAVVALTNGPQAQPAGQFNDVTAFGQAQQAGQYVLTYQQSANSLGTVNYALLELETVALVV